VRYPTLGELALPASPTPPRRPNSSETAPSPFQDRHSIRTRHRAVGVHRPEPAQTVGAAAGLVDAADLPLAGEDCVVRSVLVDAGAEAGRAELQHRGSIFYRSALSATIGPLNYLENRRVAVWFLQRSRFFMRQPRPKVNFSCMLQIYFNGGCVR
jgi:hypothetical protein